MSLGVEGLRCAMPRSRVALTGLPRRRVHLASAVVPGDDAAASEFSAAAQLGKEPGSCDPYDPKSPEFCSPVAVESPFLSKRTAKLVGLFTLWYVLNTAYNIGNKLVLTALPIPWTSATIELFFGLPRVFAGSSCMKKQRARQFFFLSTKHEKKRTQPQVMIQVACIPL